MSPIGAAVPTIESWQIKEGQLHLVTYTCVGTVDFETYGSVGSAGGDGRSTVRWEGNAPGDNTTDEANYLIDETTLRHADMPEQDGPANTHHEAELGEFSRICGQAGKALAGFVL